MAFFKFRKDGDEHTAPPRPTESVEAMRKRAKHRLIGAAVLVLIGVVGFPMLFDNQPRPIPVDLPINIPDKNTVKPLGNLPVGNAAPAMIEEIEEPAAKPPSKPASKPASEVLAPAPVPAASRAVAGALAKAAEKPVLPKLDTPKVEAPKPEVPKPASAKPEAAKADGSKAQSLLEGKETFVPAAPSSTAMALPPAVSGLPEAAVGSAAPRFVVQVGAFSDATKARDARAKLEAAGLKTYTHVIDTKEGKRIRVRVGPFDAKAETEKVAAKVRKLDLPAVILEL